MVTELETPILTLGDHISLLASYDSAMLNGVDTPYNLVVERMQVAEEAFLMIKKTVTLNNEEEKIMAILLRHSPLIPASPPDLNEVGNLKSLITRLRIKLRPEGIDITSKTSKRQVRQGISLGYFIEMNEFADDKVRKSPLMAVFGNLGQDDWDIDGSDDEIAHPKVREFVTQVLDEVSSKGIFSKGEAGITVLTAILAQISGIDYDVHYQALVSNILNSQTTIGHISGDGWKKAYFREEFIAMLIYIGCYWNDRLNYGNSNYKSKLDIHYRARDMAIKIVGKDHPLADYFRLKGINTEVDTGEKLDDVLKEKAVWAGLTEDDLNNILAAFKRLPNYITVVPGKLEEVKLHWATYHAVVSIGTKFAQLQVINASSNKDSWRKLASAQDFVVSEFVTLLQVCLLLITKKKNTKHPIKTLGELYNRFTNYYYQMIEKMTVERDGVEYESS